jgi:hypothetical protein
MSGDITNLGPQDPMIMFLERVMRDPVFPIEKAQAAMQLAVEQQKRIAERAFVFDLNAMQIELTQILRDKPNPAFHSKYASLEAIDKAARPIYTKYGFSITYGTAPSSRDGWVQVTCRLAHRSGHSEINCLEGPASTEGARGGRIGATPIQAVGSAVTYLRRYLLQLTLNLVTASDVEDDDGNGHKDKDTGTGGPKNTTGHDFLEVVAQFEAAAGRIMDSDEARKLLEWRPGVAAITGLPHGDARQRYMMARSKVMADWMTNKDDGSSASEDPIEGL